MKNNVLSIIAVCVFIFSIIFAVVPLFGKNYIPTHDGEYHIIRIVEFARMIREGYLFPRWAPTLNSGYGVPVFEFNYPFPNYIGDAVSSGLHDAVRSFQMAQAIGYIVAVAALFGWLFTLFGLIPAAVGATVGAFVPYWFVDMYVRGSIGEIFATAFLFCVLLCIEKKRFILVAVSYALLILSHNILAMVYTPFILCYALIRDKKALWAMFAGLGLSAYFWLPALLEEKYVVGLNTVNFREHFVQIYELLIPSWGTEFSGTGSMGNKISFQIGIAPIVCLILAAFQVRRTKAAGLRYLMNYLYAILGLSIIGMLTVSQFIWVIVKPLQFIQYPWRLLSFVIPVSAFAAGFWVSNSKKQWVGIVIAVVAVLLSSSYVRPVLYQPRSEAYYLARTNFTDSTSSMGNSFSTIWTGWKVSRPLSPITVENGNVIRQNKWKYMDKQFTVSMSDSGVITLNTLYFPGWVATVDGHTVPIHYLRDGVIHFSVPHGVHTIRVTFTETVARLAGDILSVISLVVLFGWGILRYRRK